MKAIILARVSTEEQKDAGNSLPAQIVRLQKYCEQKGFIIVKTFSFDESAYKTKRNDFDKILDYIKNSKEKIAVCFDKVDRFSRNIFDKRVSLLYDLTMEGKIELHFSSDNLILNPNISATQKFHFGINLGLSKYFSDAIGDSVKRSNEAKIRRGEWSGKAPFGYLNTINEKGIKNIIPDPVRRGFVQNIFEMYATGNISIKGIKEKINKTGIKSNTKTPKFLSTSDIYHILINPFYYGMMRNKGVLNRHIYLPLISKDLFDKVQDVRWGYHKKPFKYASKPAIFRGLIKCSDSKCNCGITPEFKKGHIYYSCTNYHKIHSKRVYVREEELLKPINELLNNINLPDKKINFIVEGLKNSHKAKNKFLKTSLVEMRKEYDILENRVSKLLDCKLDGSITDDMYTNKLKEIKERQTEINNELQLHNEIDENYYITVNTVLNLAKKAKEIFESSEVAEKRQLLNFLLQNCELKDKNLIYKLKIPFDTVLLASKCSNLLPGSDSNRRPTR